MLDVFHEQQERLNEQDNTHERMLPPSLFYGL